MTKNNIIGFKSKPGKLQKLILQVINYLGGRYGKSIIIDYILGRQSEVIDRNSLEKTKYFGVYTIKPTLLVDELQKLIFDKYLTYSSSLHPTLVLTEKGNEFTDKSEPVYEPEVLFENLKDNKDDDLFKKLVSLTNVLSQRENVTPSSILDAKILRMLSSVQPVIPRELECIPLVSGTFVHKFGSYYLQCIKEHKESKEKAVLLKPKLTEMVKKALDDIQSGRSVRETAIMYGLEPGAFAKEICEFIETGLKLNIKSLIDINTLNLVESYLKKYPMAKLKDINRELNLDTDFATLRIVVTHLRNQL
jgi:hypothetical protein